jgi:ribosomal protein S18 acetylase RimI-like enzyme
MPTADWQLAIRDAVVGDQPVIVEFNRLLALETEQKILDPTVLTRGVEKALGDPRRLRYWLAVARFSDTATAIGQTAVSYEWSDWRDGWIWWLQSVYVRPQFRGQGVFKALYRHVCREAKAQGDVVGIRLYVENENRHAQETYASLGMKPGGYLVLEDYRMDG